jgi:hypothetical protein
LSSVIKTILEQSLSDGEQHSMEAALVAISELGRYVPLTKVLPDPSGTRIFNNAVHL